MLDDDFGRDALALQVLGLLAATASSRNSTLDAIAAAVPAPHDWTLEDSVPFSSARKWSGARVSGRGSWVLGAPEIVAADGVPAAAQARTRAGELAEDGLRVLLLAHTDAPLNGDMLPDGLVPVGLVILTERIRSDAPQTLRYFQEQGVEIKVISGDNPATVATVAAKAGVPGSERAIDSRHLPEGEALAELMEDTTVFGRVNPDQKCAMVEALQQRGHTVAMTGDGVNDVLALKQADMGIAMGTGTAAAQAVSQLVLVDSRFSTLPGVMAEGRRVTANIERVANLFTTKSVWAAALAISIAALAVSYPILPRHLSLIDALVIGIPGFFLALGTEHAPLRAGVRLQGGAVRDPYGPACRHHHCLLVPAHSGGGGIGGRGPYDGDSDLLRHRSSGHRRHRTARPRMATGASLGDGRVVGRRFLHPLLARVPGSRSAQLVGDRSHMRVLRIRLVLRGPGLADRAAASVLERSSSARRENQVMTPPA